MVRFSLYSFVFILLASCSSNTSKESMADSLSVEENEFIEYDNPPEEGFNQTGSDLLATLLADKAMIAMGGRKAWDKTRYISWNFFGKRNHLWDKWTGDIRIEDLSNDLTFLMNIDTKKGEVIKGGHKISDSLDFYLNKGYELWVNDAYWLVMPFKLKDSGLTLKYLREDTTLTGKRADVIRLSFEHIGVTPENIYDVWIDIDSKLVTQWAFYPDSTFSKPQFVTTWDDYKEYGEILLASNRGKYKLSDIQVMEEVPEEMFTSF